MTINQPIKDLLECVSVPFERAKAMPPSVYTDPEFLRSELENIFAKDWICVGRADALANPGDFLTYELAGQPLLIVRATDGSLAAMSNVCLHRMSAIAESCGSGRSFVCPYHGWTYNLDGTLRGAPAMHHNAAFDKTMYRLPPVRCEEWLGWIMVTLNESAASVATSLTEVSDLIGDYAMETYVSTFRETHVWDTNWKVLAENFMESYHLPACHKGTVGGLSKLEEMDCPVGRRSFNYHTFLKDDRLTIALAHPSNTRLKGDRRRTTVILNVYPSLYITLTPGYFWYLSLHPRGVGQVNIIYGGGMSPDFATSPEAQGHFAEVKKLLDDVNVEDHNCIKRVFQGLSSKTASPGHLSHLERPIFDFAQYLAEKTANFERRFTE